MLKNKYRKILTNILRITSYLVAILVMIWSGLFIYFTEPYIIELEEVRTTGKQETIQAYWGRTCGEDFISEGQPGTRLTLVVPENGITPADTHAVVPDNVFIITGYRYKSIQKNILNGDIKEIPSPRVDVISWYAVAPYSIYVDDKDVLIKQSTAPLGWQSTEPSPEFTYIKQAETGGC